SVLSFRLPLHYTPPLSGPLLFFFQQPPPPEAYPLSLHDALPISRGRLDAGRDPRRRSLARGVLRHGGAPGPCRPLPRTLGRDHPRGESRPHSLRSRPSGYHTPRTIARIREKHLSQRRRQAHLGMYRRDILDPSP